VLLFDWKKVYDTAEGNISSCILIMEMLIKKQLPKNKYDRIYNYSNKNFTGPSFLLHGDLLLYHSYKYTTKELCIYYALASLRSYADYIAYNKTTLDPLHCPVDLSEINDNRLLIVLQDEITFIYEEVTLETIH
jgi:hypothetical protein|tara:strand:+ start:2268 stop:2669 length:402 start_codon:yes stop_codon:yes gene_type:complete